MSILTLIDRLPPKSGCLENFCNKRLKYIRVTIDLINSLCLAIFYKLAAAFSSNEKKYCRYLFFSHYYLCRTNRFFTYRQFGNEVVDFCMNYSKRIKEPLPASPDEMRELEKIYGRKFLDGLNKRKPEHTLLLKEKLARLGKDGCCTGISYDFIFHYLKQKQAGKSSLEAIKATSYRYIDGASDQAELAQIFYNGSVVESSIETEFQRLESAFKKAKDDAIADVEQNWKDEHGENNREIMQRIAETVTQSLQKALEYSCYKAGLRLQAAANICGLRMQSPTYLRQDLLADTAPYKKFIQELPVGAYLLHLSGHAIVFIKEQDLCCICESNKATVVVSKNVADKLLKLSKDYSKNKEIFFGFYPCVLEN